MPCHRNVVVTVPSAASSPYDIPARNATRPLNAPLVWPVRENAQRSGVPRRDLPRAGARMFHIVSALTFAATVATAKVDSAAEMRREDLMAALRGGGYTVILRHARTDKSFQEQIATVP